MYHCNSTDCLFSSFTGMIVFFLCVLTIECIIYKIIWKARAWIGDSWFLKTTEKVIGVDIFEILLPVNDCNSSKYWYQF